MQQVATLLSALARGVGKLWGKGCIGKVIVGFLALVIIGICAAPFRGASTTTTPLPATPVPAAQVAATAPQPTEAPAPTRAPTATQTPKPPAPPTSEPTDVPQPTAAALVPTKASEVPTSARAAAAKPTAVSQPAASGPTYQGSGGSQTVDPPWWPCQKGQIKGNRNSGIYHIPTGRSYAKTFKDVACFNTAIEAEAAGFRAAKN
jgi:cytoskeletal protein RodZ